MKALFFNKPGIENLIFGDYQLPHMREDEILVETKCISVNPIDYYTVTGIHGQNGPPMKITPYPHIAGSEISGIVKSKGKRVNNTIREGDRVIIYNRVFDGICKYCMNNHQMLCENGGMIGISRNGGFAEYIIVPKQNIIKIPDELDWELASSLPIAGLTAFNAIQESTLKSKDNLVIFGGSGNTGLFCAQFGKIIGTITISLSTKPWIKEYGANYVLPIDENIIEKISEITNGAMADVVINSLGEKTWAKGMEIVGKLGKIITFGVLTGGNLFVDGRLLYNKQITIKGTTGGSVEGLLSLIEMAKGQDIRTRIWKRYSLEDSRIAIEKVFDKNKEGRIIIEN
ncbi:MAG TPA: alcohol dehydrogenase catalytic domain-containing protein [Candidatus Nitrosocosmicus sp.]|nr:alcohol dehydrogenase catalytic domain-containing protein [Candidatus Nitrosocosmicus sp.]